MKGNDHYCNNVKVPRYICAGLGCKNQATSILNVKYINKKGYFCHTCCNDLLQSELAEKVNSFDNTVGGVL